MEILGVGFNELIFIIIIALIILGPKDMQKAGRTIGKWMRDVVTSDGWKVFQKTSRELRTLPNKLMREANEELNQINNEMRDVTGVVSGRPSKPIIPSSSNPLKPAPPAFPDNKIAPSNTDADKADGTDQEGNA